MGATHDLRTLEESFPSSLDSYQGFIKQVLQGLSDRGWDSELFGIEMALEEAISNAIRHGNKLSPDKRVHAKCRISDSMFWAQISDEGSGFDPGEVPDCTRDERLQAPGGRGLALICHYMNKVQYNQIGNRLTMQMHREESPSENHDQPSGES